MNIGREVATIASQSGTRRRGARTGAGAAGAAGWVGRTVVIGGLQGKKALNDYLALDDK